MAESRSSEETLSEGTLDMMMNDKMDGLTPVVQVLHLKLMNNNHIRTAIWDGISACQHTIFLAEESDELYRDGKLDKYAIVRLDDYTLSRLPNKGDLCVILVNKLTLIKSGELIGKKLGKGEPFSTTNTTAATTTTDIVEETSANAKQESPKAKDKSFASYFESSFATTGAGTSRTSPGKLRRETVCPINIISPFFNAWTIRARVTTKAPMKTWSNSKNSGKLFSFDVVDESGEIRITAFNAEADKFFDLIEVNKVYLISKGNAKAANKKFTNLKHDYEISLVPGSIIEPCSDSDQENVPKVHFNFKPLAEINNEAVRTIVDVIGIIRMVGEMEKIVSKRTQKELIKREITIADSTLTEVKVALWDTRATEFTGQVGQVVAIRAVTVGDFHGKNLSTTFSSFVQVQPEIPETDILQSWYSANGNNAKFTSLSREPGSNPAAAKQQIICLITPKLIESIAPNPAYFNITGNIQTTNRSTNHLYKSCGKDGCQKKVEQDSLGMYHCSKCGNESPVFIWRLMISLCVCDVTGPIWLTVFQKEAEHLIGRTVEELAQLYDRSNNEYNTLMTSLRLKSYTFRIGVRLEEYQNEQRTRAVAYKISPINAVNRSKQLLNMIDILSNQVKA